MDIPGYSPAQIKDAEESVKRLLRQQPQTVRDVLAALMDGRIDGDAYYGECACLIGTIGKAAVGARRWQWDNYLEMAHMLGVAPSRSMPGDRRTIGAESFFTAIHPGDTPENNPYSELAAQWCRDVLDEIGRDGK